MFLRMLATKQLTVPIDFNSMEKNTMGTDCLPRFFKIFIRIHKKNMFWNISTIQLTAAIDFNSMEKKYNGYRLFVYPDSSKYLLEYTKKICFGTFQPYS